MCCFLIDVGVNEMWIDGHIVWWFSYRLVVLCFIKWHESSVLPKIILLHRWLLDLIVDSTGEVEFPLFFTATVWENVCGQYNAELLGFKLGTESCALPLDHFIPLSYLCMFLLQHLNAWSEMVTTSSDHFSPTPMHVPSMCVPLSVTFCSHHRCPTSKPTEYNCQHIFIPAKPAPTAAVLPQPWAIQYWLCPAVWPVWWPRVPTPRQHKPPAEAQAATGGLYFL